MGYDKGNVPLIQFLFLQIKKPPEKSGGFFVDKLRRIAEFCSTVVYNILSEAALLLHLSQRLFKS